MTEVGWTMPILVKRGLILVALVFAWLFIDGIVSMVLGAQAGGFVGLLVAGYFIFACWQAWTPPASASRPPVVVAPPIEPPVDSDSAVR